MTARRKRDWLARYLLAPDQVLAAGDPIAIALHDKYKAFMPNLRLSPEDVIALLSYFDKQNSAPRERAQNDSVHAHEAKDAQALK